MPFMGHSHIHHSAFTERFHVFRMLNCRYVLSGVAALLVTGCATAPRSAAAAPAAQPVIATAPAPAPATATPATSAPVPAPQSSHVIEPVQPDANPQVASVAEALTTKSHPERLSALVPPPPFSLIAYQKDPAAYLNQVVPGRAFQSAQPAPGVPELQPVTPAPKPLDPGQSVTLSVRTAPHGVTSWTSMDLGSFPNGLTAISVAADANGLASTTFSASPGVSGRVQVLAGSPMASGQVSYRIIVNASPILVAPPTSSASGVAP